MTPTWLILAVPAAVFAIARTAGTLRRRAREAAHFTAWGRELASERSDR